MIDAVVDDEAAAEELDSHDDAVASLQVRLETLLTIPAASALTLTSDIRSIAERRLDQLDARLSLAVSTYG